MLYNCSYCNKSDFLGYRYRCLECEAFNLCDQCFFRKRTTFHKLKYITHKTNHKMIRIHEASENEDFESRVTLTELKENIEIQNVIHKFVSCNICEIQEIRGLRFKCSRSRTIHPNPIFFKYSSAYRVSNSIPNPHPKKSTFSEYHT
jgi:hypothetical protein